MSACGARKLLHRRGCAERTCQKVGFLRLQHWAVGAYTLFTLRYLLAAFVLFAEQCHAYFLHSLRGLVSCVSSSSIMPQVRQRSV